MESAQDENYFGLFRSQRQALKQLLRLADQYFLCHQMLGLETCSGKPCFRSQLKKCFGCCLGVEPAETYNERVVAAIKHYQRRQWPFFDAVVIEEASLEDPDESLWHVIDHWRYMGQVRSAGDIHSLGYRVSREKKSERRTTLADHVTASAETDDYIEGRINFDLDIYYIFVRFLLSKEKMALNHLRVWPLERLSLQFDCPGS
jgi:hypothetical protein